MLYSVISRFPGCRITARKGPLLWVIGKQITTLSKALPGWSYLLSVGCHQQKPLDMWQLCSYSQTRILGRSKWWSWPAVLLHPRDGLDRISETVRDIPRT